MTSIRVRAGAAVLALVLAACGGSDSVDSTSEQPAATQDGASGDDSSSATGGLVPTVSGGQLDLNSIEGQDTVLWFWAPW